MFDILKDAVKIGVGALFLSKENLKKVTENLSEVGKASKEEGERLFKEMEEAREKVQKDLKQLVDDSVSNAIEQAGLAPKEEFDALRTRVAELEAQIRELKEKGA